MSSRSNLSPDPDRADPAAMPGTTVESALSSSGLTHSTAPTRFVDADGIRFAYGRFGNPIGTPIVLLQHFMGNLDTTTRRSMTLSRRAAR
jgi:hypothetical protein